MSTSSIQALKTSHMTVKLPRLDPKRAHFDSNVEIQRIRTQIPSSVTTKHNRQDGKHISLYCMIMLFRMAGDLGRSICDTADANAHLDPSRCTQITTIGDPRHMDECASVTIEYRRRDSCRGCCAELEAWISGARLATQS